MAAVQSRASQEPDYSRTVKRLVAVLRADPVMDKMVNYWREGDMPERHRAAALPAVYVAAAPRPQSVRRPIGSAPSVSDLPAEQIGADYHVVALAGGASPSEAQVKVFDIGYRVRLVLGANVQLRDEDGEDPLCGTLELVAVPRLMEKIGDVLEGIATIVRTHNYRTVGI